MNKLIIGLVMLSLLLTSCSVDPVESDGSILYNMRVNTVYVKILIGDTQVGHGSGVFLNKGEILSCQHVASGNETYVVVDFFGNSHDVIRVRSKEEYDLAILDIDPNGVSPEITGVVLGEASVGDTVYAIGTPILEDLQGTVTKGIVSGSREDAFEDMAMLQHDAAINPGNSGGPLFNENGELVGINRILVAPYVPQWCGLGLAVRYDVIADFYRQYLAGDLDPITLEDIYEMLVRLP